MSAEDTFLMIKLDFIMNDKKLEMILNLRMNMIKLQGNLRKNTKIILIVKYLKVHGMDVEVLIRNKLL